MWDGGKGMAPSLRRGPILLSTIPLIIQRPGWMVICHLHPAPPLTTGQPKAAVLTESSSDGPMWDRQGCDSRCHRHVAHARPKRHGSVSSGSQSPLCPPSPRSRAPGRQAARVAELGVPDRGPLLTGSLPTARRSQRRAAGGQALPSMDMGSRMPNCLSTAMNSRTTTAMAHSSIPWMPMAALALPPRRGAGAARRLLGRPRLTCPRQAGPRVSAGPRPRAGRRR